MKIHTILETEDEILILNDNNIDDTIYSLVKQKAKIDKLNNLEAEASILLKTTDYSFLCDNIEARVSYCSAYDSWKCSYACDYAKMMIDKLKNGNKR